MTTALIPSAITLGLDQLVGLVLLVGGIAGLVFFAVGIRFERREAARRHRIYRRDRG